MLTFEGVGIESLVSVVPEKKISNLFFSDLLTEKELKVFEKTVKIRERRWAEENVTAMDLGLRSAQILMKESNTKSDDIGAVLFLSQTADFKIPFCSNIIHAKLGLNENTLCLDINAGCAGFIQGLFTSFSIAKTLGGKKVLLILSETLSKILSLKDRSTCMLFGDGASAVLISEDSIFKDSFFNIYSDGSNYDAIMIPEGGFGASVASSISELENTKLKMDGQRVFDFTLREVAPSITQLVEDARLNTDNLTYYLLHQSNAFIIDQIAAKLKEPKDKFLKNIEKYGNTSSVSIPLLISDNVDQIKNSDKILLSGYGSGLNWGNAILDIKASELYPIIDYER